MEPGFAPPVASIQEFKIDNSTFSAEYGHVSGAIVNLVTRSGTDQFRGEAYEFFRHDALDARNFFEFTTPDPQWPAIGTECVIVFMEGSTLRRRLPVV